MKHKVIGITLIAVGIVGLSFVLFARWYTLELQKQAELEIERNVRNSVFLVEHEVGGDNETEPILLAPDADLIDYIEQDQTVEEVTEYRNVLEIPKIDCRAYIGEGTTAYNLSRGVGHDSDTVKVGEAGNCVIAGHASLSWWCIFNRLEEMQIFDTFNAYDATGQIHTYCIIKRFVCSAEQLSIKDNTDDGRSTITIYTCTEGGTRRFVLVGTEFVDDEDFNKFKSEYYSDYVEQLEALNFEMSVEPVTKQLDMRDTERVYTNISKDKIELRPWLTDDLVYSDSHILNFGILGTVEVVDNDVA